MTTLLEENLDQLDPAVVHWSTSTILTIFFSASLVAALFFGLGFTFGPAQTTKFGAANPSNAAVIPPQISNSLAQTASLSGSARPNLTPRNGSKSSPEKLHLQSVPATGKLHGSVPAAMESKPPVASPANAGNRPADTQASGNRYMVQVGAIGNRRDAQTLVSRLRRQGFHAGIYPGKRDKFLHVQLGPFANTQQAQTVRHRVMAHGYHALLKPAT